MIDDTKDKLTAEELEDIEELEKLQNEPSRPLEDILKDLSS